jgi:nucleotide-binding universal stress UspA family protein
MNRILLPTDFSDVADNAIKYAAEIAKITGASITLFHVYHVPVITTDVPIVMPTMDDLEKDSVEALENLRNNLSVRYPGVSIDCHCECGLVVDELEEYLKENIVDLIVMGTQGAGYLSEKLLGSVTTSLMQKIKVPVLVIDKEVSFQTIKRIALACDYKKTSKETIDPVREFAKLFGAHVYIVNVIKKDADIIPSTDQAAVGVQIDHLFGEIEHSFHYAQNDDVVEGLNNFIQEYKIDLIVMMPREHSALRNLFHEPDTKRMAFHTETPFLSLHE